MGNPKSIQNKFLIQSGDNAVDELQSFDASRRIFEVYGKLEKEAISSDLKHELQEIILSYGSLFSVAAPIMDDMSFEDVLIVSNQEIKISRLLKERGIYRLAYALEMEDDDGLPIWQQLIDEKTGEPFERREDVIHAFCSAAHISKATIFTRLSLYRMMMYIGYTMEEAYQYILLRPSVLYQALLKLGDWSWKSSRLEAVDVEVARSLISHYAPEDQEMSILLQDAESGGKSQEEELKTKLKPIMRSLVDELTTLPNVKEAMKYLNVDILSAPMVNFYWNNEESILVAKVSQPVLDEFGNVVETDEVIIPLFADTEDGTYPEPLKEELIQRLPIRNRKEI